MVNVAVRETVEPTVLEANEQVCTNSSAYAAAAHIPKEEVLELKARTRVVTVSDLPRDISLVADVSFIC